MQDGEGTDACLFTFASSHVCYGTWLELPRACSEELCFERLAQLAEVGSEFVILGVV